MLFAQHKNKDMKNGFYTTPNGEIMEVLDFDPINKMVYVPLANGNFTWVHDNEYSAWQKVGEDATEVTEEEPKKKAAPKKKEK